MFKSCRVMIAMAALIGSLGVCFAQDSRSTTSSASEEGKADPHGAIRSLEDASRDKPANGPVTIPDLGTDGPSRTGGTPRGTPTAR